MPSVVVLSLDAETARQHHVQLPLLCVCVCVCHNRRAESITVIAKEPFLRPPPPLLDISEEEVSDDLCTLSRSSIFWGVDMHSVLSVATCSPTM